MFGVPEGYDLRSALVGRWLKSKGIRQNNENGTCNRPSIDSLIRSSADAEAAHSNKMKTAQQDTTATGRITTWLRSAILALLCLVTFVSLFFTESMYQLVSEKLNITQLVTTSSSTTSAPRSTWTDTHATETTQGKPLVGADQNDPILNANNISNNSTKLNSEGVASHRPVVHENNIPKKVDSTLATSSTLSPRNINSHEEIVTAPVAGHFDNVTVCGGCLLSPLSEAITCASRIYQLMEAEGNNSKRTSFATAAADVAQAYPEQCHRCNQTIDQESCPAAARGYWKFDVAAPRSLRARSSRLSSIPPDWRIPDRALGALKKYFNDPLHRRHYAWEWNPSIVHLPPDQVPEHLQSDNSNQVPVYIASYRVSKRENCFSQNWIKEMLSEPFLEWKDLVGIALLKADFSVAADIVLHVNQQQFFRIQDPRIFLLRGQLYLGSFEKITPLWLRMQPNKTDASIVTLNSFFGASNFSVILRKSGSCCNSRDCQGKNFNYFIDAKQRTMVETNPYGPHNVEEMKLEWNCQRVQTMQFNRSYRSAYVPAPSFHNFDELAMPQHGLFSPPYSSDRGTTCCIEIDDPRNTSQKLLMGVSHFKTQMNGGPQGFTVRSRQYFSRLYAFEPIEPYNIVAVSGAFCMGMPSAAEVEQNPYNQFVLQRPLIFMGETMDCPEISFISGMTTNAHDPSKIILSYGMNDCTGRIVEVEKAELVQMLFDHGSRQRPAWTQAIF